MKWGVFTISAFLVGSGCSLFPGRISLGKASVTAVKDAGKPASLASSESGEFVALPEGSKVIVTKSEAVAAIPATKAGPAISPQPAKEVTEIVPGGATEWRKTENSVSANTGTVDTSIRTHEINAAEGRPLLYASIVAALAAGFFVYRAYPTPAICCGGGSVVFFLAWRMSDLPPWVAGLGLAAIAGGVFLYVGHERGQKNPAA